MPPATYLFKSPHNIYYFRLVTPKSIRCAFPKTSKEIRKTLHTSNLKKAEAQSRIIWSNIQIEWKQLITLMTDIEDLISEFESDLPSFGIQGSEDRARIDKILSQVKSQYLWLKERNLAKDINSIDDIRALYTESKPLYQEAYSRSHALKREQKLKNAMSFFADPPSNPNALNSVFSENIPQNQSVNKPIDEVASLFINEQVKSEVWSSRTKTEYVYIYDVFSELLNNMPLSEVTKKHMRSVKASFMNFPPNIKKKSEFKNKDLHEILSKTNETTISVITINQHLTKISALFKWATDNGYANDNPAEGLKLKENKKNTIQRDKFTDEELTKLFNLPVHLYNEARPPSKFWVPLLALFTGAMLICS